ncbi:hypothetical protein AB1N83_000957 [Pleurotus pulmonarius]
MLALWWRRLVLCGEECKAWRGKEALKDPRYSVGGHKMGTFTSCDTSNDIHIQDDPCRAKARTHAERDKATLATGGIHAFVQVGAVVDNVQVEPTHPPLLILQYPISLARSIVLDSSVLPDPVHEARNPCLKDKATLTRIGPLRAFQTQRRVPTVTITSYHNSPNDTCVV